MPNHYDTLGVEPGATAKEIRKAYLRRARALHPDRQQGRSAADARRAEEAMRQVNVAWNVLSDSTKRSAYDATIRSAPATTRQANSRPRTSERPQQQRQTSPNHASTRSARTEHREPSGRRIDEEDGDGSVSVWASLPVLVVVGVLLGILLVSAFGNSGEPVDNRPIAPELDDQVREGNCFVFIGDSIQAEACMSGRADGEVVDVVPDPGNCPTGTEALVQGEFVLCYQRLVAGSGVSVESG